MCMYYEYDEEYEEYCCTVSMDEDELYRMNGDPAGGSCPYYRPGDDYKIVHKQI